MKLTSPNILIIQPEIPENESDEATAIDSCKIASKCPSRKTLGAFQVQYGTSWKTDIGSTIDLDNFDTLEANLQGYFLGTGYSKDFQSGFKSSKKPIYQNLLQIIRQDEDYQNVSGFICCGEVVEDILQTCLKRRFSGWEIYAWKFHNWIVLWKDSQEDVTPESYYEICYKALIKGKGKNTKIPQTLKFNGLKQFQINEVTFDGDGGNKILMACEIDDVDVNGEFVGIRLHKEFSPKPLQAKYLSYWAQAVVAGYQKLIIGTRDYRGKLQKTEIINVENILEHVKNAQQMQSACFDFQDRFLTWVKNSFISEEDSKIKKFIWTGPETLLGDRVIRINFDANDTKYAEISEFMAEYVNEIHTNLLST